MVLLFDHETKSTVVLAQLLPRFVLLLLGTTFDLERGMRTGTRNATYIDSGTIGYGIHYALNIYLKTKLN